MQRSLPFVPLCCLWDQLAHAHISWGQSRAQSCSMQAGGQDRRRAQKILVLVSQPEAAQEVQSQLQAQGLTCAVALDDNEQTAVCTFKACLQKRNRLAAADQF